MKNTEAEQVLRQCSQMSVYSGKSQQYLVLTMEPFLCPRGQNNVLQTRFHWYPQTTLQIRPCGYPHCVDELAEVQRG